MRLACRACYCAALPAGGCSARSSCVLTCACTPPIAWAKAAPCVASAARSASRRAARKSACAAWSAACAARRRCAPPSPASSSSSSPSHPRCHCWPSTPPLPLAAPPSNSASAPVATTMIGSRFATATAGSALVRSTQSASEQSFRWCTERRLSHASSQTPTKVRMSPPVDATEAATVGRRSAAAGPVGDSKRSNARALAKSTRASTQQASATARIDSVRSASNATSLARTPSSNAGASAGKSMSIMSIDGRTMSRPASFTSPTIAPRKVTTEPPCVCRNSAPPRST
mmetsp:Transcript_3596/g.14571  ORF Transcript_3596/g.14571 Transcript_3596/m.14571 type:complete len:287 (-) Transcript_3596:2309-3169(-)